MKLKHVWRRFIHGIGCTRAAPVRVRLVHFLLVNASIFLLFLVYSMNDGGGGGGFASSSVRLLPDAPADEKHNATRLILFWTSFFDQPDFYLGFGQRPFLGCPVSACSTTADRGRVAAAHAVVFHARDLNRFDLPPVRRLHQRWVFFLYESPLHTYIDLGPFGGFFNWTMTYRFDSDFPPSVRLVRRTDDDAAPANASSEATPGRDRRKPVAWIVSNCQTYNHRERYVAELQRHIQVDVFGECGTQNDVCSREASLDECYARIERNYKFYLSFENSNCRDYFTEKWTNVVNYDLVPVVYGGADYAAFAPPHSYVNVLDFASPRQLAQRLRELDANETLYREYSRWKSQYRLLVDTMPWCDVCAKLHDPSQPSKSYPDIHRWWVEEGNCTNSLQLPEMGRSVVGKYADYLADQISAKFDKLVFNAKSKFNLLKR